MEFIAHCSVVSVPSAIAGFLVCFSLEFFRCPGFRYQMPERARELILKDYNKKIHELTGHNVYVYVVQMSRLPIPNAGKSTRVNPEKLQQKDS